MPSAQRDRLTITRDQLLEAGNAAGVAGEQVDRLWSELLLRVPVANATTGFYYLGGALMFLAAVGAAAWFSQYATYASACFVCIGLAIAFVYGGNSLSKKSDMRVASGLLYVLTTCMAPAIVITAAGAMFKRADDINGVILTMNLAAVAVGGALTRRSRISFVILPALLAGLGAAQTLNEMIFVQHAWFDTSSYVVDAVYGLFAIALATALDRNSKEDFAFWAYLVGVAAFWAGLTLLDKNGLGFAFYAFGGLVSMALAVVFSRNVFAVFGGGAIVYYFAHLGYDVFGWSLTFIIVLGALGASALWLTTLYRRHADAVDAVVLSMVPSSFKRILSR